MPQLRLFLIVCLVAGGALAAGATAAAADPCTHDLTDSQGFSWGLQDNGHVVGPGSAGFDDLGLLAVDKDGDGSFSTYAGTLNGCAAPEEGGREIVFPPETLDGDFEVTRKVYVPASGTGFIRWLDVIHNVSGGFRDLEVELRADAETSTFLRVTGTSSGDRALTPTDAWVTWEDTRGTFTAAGQLMDATEPSTLTKYRYFAGSRYLRDGDQDSLHLRYASIRLVPDQSIALMHFAVQRNTASETITFAQVHGGGSPELYAGLSAGERSLLVNWPVEPPSTDPDADGVLNPFDNCPANANAGQADLDGDGVGDPCDPDQDGDGVSDAVETAVGSDRRRVDTDGDGKPDGGDSCPTLSSAATDGCPAAVTRPRFTLRGLPARVKRSTLLRRGLRVTVDPEKSASFVLELVGRLRGARSARAGDVVLAERSLRSSTVRRTVRLKPARRLRGLVARRMRLTLRITALDAAGNRRIVRRPISIR
jgi:hypothetical protein